MPCTSLPCYWLPPTFKTVRFARICDIDFTAPPKNKQLLNHHQQVPLYTPPSSNPTSDMKPSASELDNFFKTLPEIGKPVAILSIVPIFCEVYVPLHVKGDLPSPLKKL